MGEKLVLKALDSSDPLFAYGETKDLKIFLEGELGKLRSEEVENLFRSFEGKFIFDDLILLKIYPNSREVLAEGVTFRANFVRVVSDEKMKEEISLFGSALKVETSDLVFPSDKEKAESYILLQKNIDLERLPAWPKFLALGVLALVFFLLYRYFIKRYHVKLRKKNLIKKLGNFIQVLEQSEKRQDFESFYQKKRELSALINEIHVEILKGETFEQENFDTALQAFLLEVDQIQYRKEWQSEELKKIRERKYFLEQSLSSILRQAKGQKK